MVLKLKTATGTEAVLKINTSTYAFMLMKEW